MFLSGHDLSVYHVPVFRLAEKRKERYSKEEDTWHIEARTHIISDPFPSVKFMLYTEILPI